MAGNTINVQGAYIDVHDNAHVYLSVDKAEVTMRDGMEKEGEKKTQLGGECLARAIENCQEYFWGNSAYAVVYCVCRDDYDMMNLTQSGFERMVEMLPYLKRRDYKCTPGTIANAFSNNPFYKSHVSRWELQGAPERIIKLLNQLRKELAG